VARGKNFRILIEVKYIFIYIQFTALHSFFFSLTKNHLYNKLNRENFSLVERLFLTGSPQKPILLIYLRYFMVVRSLKLHLQVHFFSPQSASSQPSNLKTRFAPFRATPAFIIDFRVRKIF